ncbi:MAG: hypothetical protein V3V45_04185 [Candidatus Brocadiales bacterium]
MHADVTPLGANMDENPSLKAIIDIVAYKISKSEESKGREANFQEAKAALKEYIADHFKNPEDFLARASHVSGDTKGLQEIAEAIYRYRYRKKGLTFDVVKDRIEKEEDIALRTITDLVAYKIYQSPDDKGPEVNLITAETFVAEYISENFISLDDFDRRLQDLGHDVSALRAFADDTYEYYRKH